MASPFCMGVLLKLYRGRVLAYSEVPILENSLFVIRTSHPVFSKSLEGLVSCSFNELFHFLIDEFACQSGILRLDSHYSGFRKTSRLDRFSVLNTNGTTGLTKYQLGPHNLRELPSQLFHPGVGLLVLLVITILSVFKPRGITPYGWRKQQEQRKVAQP